VIGAAGTQLMQGIVAGTENTAGAQWQFTHAQTGVQTQAGVGTETVGVPVDPSE